MAEPRLLSIQIGPVRALGDPEGTDPADRLWTTGLFKASVDGPVWLSAAGLPGDQQADLVNHGGPHKAVNVYPNEHYAFWRESLNRPAIAAGAFGENFTTAGWLEEEVCIGDVYAIGAAAVQVSQPRGPCWKLARRWQVPDLDRRIRALGRTGWYLRVLDEGFVQAGETIRLVERAYPEWTIARVNALQRRLREDPQAAAELAACPLPP
ncbi:MAG: MOSC domain-containing protein [Chloroflexi bacterium]|nr:MOSC domain-containing protein [Chloroflexota bacterium]